MSREKLQQAVQLAKAGKKAEAYRIVSDVLNHNASDAEAWALMSQLIENRNEAIGCLDNVIKMTDSPQVREWAQTRRARLLAELNALPLAAELDETTKSSPSAPREEKPNRRKPSSCLVAVLVVIVGLVLCVSLRFLGSILPSSSVAYTPTETSTPTETPISQELIQTRTATEPENCIISDPYNTNIPQEFLHDLQAAIAIYGIVDYYDVQVDNDRRFLADVEVELGDDGNWSRALNAIETALREYERSIDIQHAGYISIRAFWQAGEYPYCANGAGMGYLTMQSIDWDSVSQSDIFNSMRPV
jgi:hypothetical protein